MRYVFRIGSALALGLALMTGCSDDGGTTAQVFPCTEQGIRDAVAQGGGPLTFDCGGPQIVVTEAEIVIDNDVILDGEGNLTIVGFHVPTAHRVLSVLKGVKAELHRLATRTYPGYTGIAAPGLANEGTLTIHGCVISGHRPEFLFGGGAGIYNAGEMIIINSTISRNFAGHGSGGGISNAGTLMLVDSTVSDNGADGDGAGPLGGGIYNDGEMKIINSTVSGNLTRIEFDNLGGGIVNGGWMSIINSSVSGNSADSGDAIAIYSWRSCADVYTEIANTLIEGDCDHTTFGSNLPWVSNGHNIESPGDTCGFNQDTDQVNVTAEQLNLGPLADNGGPTMTHALGAGSVAIDQIPELDCVDADGAPLTTDQRGEPRPGGTMCDVGAFEVQP